MDAIGWALIGTGENYEEALLLAAGPDARAGRPGITEQRLGQGLANMGVKLQSRDKLELSAFFRDRQSKAGTVELAQFFAAVGLEAQTLGAAAAAKAERPALLLSAAELS